MLLDLLKNTVTEYSEKAAIEFEDHILTYAKLFEIINKLANGLLNIGIKKGDRIIVLLPNLPHFIFAYYAILKIGAIIVPINPLFKQNEIQDIIQKTQPSTFIIWAGFYNRINNLTNEVNNVIVLGNSNPPNTKNLIKLIAAASSVEPEIELKPEDSAQIQYTPGVVDSPKGIELTHQNLTATYLSCVNMFEINSMDVYAGLLPMFLLYSQNMVMNSSLLQGAKLILYPKFSLKILNKAVFQDKISFLAGSPNMLQMLLDNNSDIDSSIPLKFVLSYGSSCSEELLLGFNQKFGIPILEGYGVTEASALISYNRNEPDQKNGSVGLPINGMKIKIVDNNDSELDRGQIGEIIVAGENIMKGYWNQSLQENGVFKNGWLYTGDLGMIDNEGFLYFIERKEDVILKSGFHIYPGEVEDILLKHPKVEQISIVGTPHPVQKQEVKACVVLKKNEQATSNEIIEFCKEQIPVYKCPKIVEFYNSLPKSATGKILKRKLRKT